MKVNEFKILLGWVLAITVINLALLIATLVILDKSSKATTQIESHVSRNMQCTGNLNVSLQPSLFSGSISNVNPLVGNVPVNLTCN